MNQFEIELKKNNFVCSECSKCRKIVWPPSDFCSFCFGQVTWRQISRNGKLIEFSKKDNVIFCIAEFENTIRIIGELETRLQKPIIGQDLYLVKCEYDGN